MKIIKYYVAIIVFLIANARQAHSQCIEINKDTVLVHHIVKTDSTGKRELYHVTLFEINKHLYNAINFPFELMECSDFDTTVNKEILFLNYRPIINKKCQDELIKAFRKKPLIPLIRGGTAQTDSFNAFLNLLFKKGGRFFISEHKFIGYFFFSTCLYNGSFLVPKFSNSSINYEKVPIIVNVDRIF